MKRLFLTLLALSGLLFNGLTAVVADDELLPPDKAFSLSAILQSNQIIATYDIAPGYYMYRSRFEYKLSPDDKKLNANFPKGKIKQDEFFGEMEVYRNRIQVKIPVDSLTPSNFPIHLVTTGQGCADIGVCYPPLKQSLIFESVQSTPVLAVAYQKPSKSTQSVDGQNVEALQLLLAEATSNLDSTSTESTQADDTKGAEALASLLSLGDEIGLDDDSDIPHPDVAFQLLPELDDNDIVQAQILIYPNTYLYKEKFDVKLVGGSGHTIGAVSLPKGKDKYDEFLGQTRVFYEQVKLSIPIISDPGASSNYQLAIQYQGCVEDRICYPPVTKYLTVDLPSKQILVDATQSELSGNSTPKNQQNNLPEMVEIPTTQSSEPTSQSEQDQFASLLSDKSLLLIIGLFFLAGIGLTFTPCVFPMIPILSSIIAGQGDDLTTRKAFWLSLIYVLSMAITYAIAGAIVGYYGAEFNIQIWFQDPLILSIFAAVFVLLALSMFGFYELQMPSAIQSRITSFSNSQQGGNFAGVALMGFFSAIIVGPCITAPLVGALLYISQTQDWLLGGTALFALGLGMGVPLLLIGTSAGKVLPRAGQWMDAVKAFFGVVMLAVAIWLLERILPTAIIMALISILLIVSSIYLGALERIESDRSGWHYLRKGIGVLLLIYGSIYMIAATSGSEDLIQPLKGIQTSSIGSSTEKAGHLNFRQIKGSSGLQSALASSVAQNRTTMFDFYADWCISCKEMEKYAFTHPEVIAALASSNMLQTDVTDNDAEDTELMASLGIYGPPAILFFDKNGQEIRHRRVVGEMSGDKFAAHVRATFPKN